MAFFIARENAIKLHAINWQGNNAKGDTKLRIQDIH